MIISSDNDTCSPNLQNLPLKTPIEITHYNYTLQTKISTKIAIILSLIFLPTLFQFQQTFSFLVHTYNNVFKLRYAFSKCFQRHHPKVLWNSSTAFIHCKLQPKSPLKLQLFYQFSFFLYYFNLNKQRASSARATVLSY